MKKYLIGGLVTSALILSAVAFAQVTVPMMVNINPSGNAQLRGTVVSTGTDSLVVKSWGGNWTIKVSDKTKLTGKVKKLADFKAGDFVGVSGKASESANLTVEAKVLQLRGEGKQRKEAKEAKKEVKVELTPVNNSGVSGKATLKEDDGKVKVKLELSKYTAGVSQPAHIHPGTCTNLGAPKYPLTNVVNGKSETTLDVTLAQLKTELPLAINVHKSTEEPGVYVACGEIKL